MRGFRACKMLLEWVHRCRCCQLHAEGNSLSNFHSSAFAKGLLDPARWDCLQGRGPSLSLDWGLEHWLLVEQSPSPPPPPPCFSVYPIDSNRILPSTVVWVPRHLIAGRGGPNLRVKQLYDCLHVQFVLFTRTVCTHLKYWTKYRHDINLLRKNMNTLLYTTSCRLFSTLDESIILVKINENIVVTSSKMTSQKRTHTIDNT